MKIELSQSALTIDGTTDPVVDAGAGTIEYRFRYPTLIEEIVVDAGNIAELQTGDYGVGVYYRNSNAVEEASGVVGNHKQAVRFEDTIEADIVSDGLYSSETDIVRQLGESGWRATLRLRRPLWCLSFGIRVWEKNTTEVEV